MAWRGVMLGSAMERKMDPWGWWRIRRHHKKVRCSALRDFFFFVRCSNMALVCLVSLFSVALAGCTGCAAGEACLYYSVLNS